jgi:hypothetical protein
MSTILEIILGVVVAIIGPVIFLLAVSSYMSCMSYICEKSRVRINKDIEIKLNESLIPKDILDTYHEIKRDS